MTGLPPTARLYNIIVIAVGAGLFAACVPFARIEQPLLFAGLLVISSLAAALNESLPRGTNESTMSVAYAVDFAALVLVGPHQAMVVAMGSVLTQCILLGSRTPVLRTMFNAASLVITIQAAGLTMSVAGGTTLARPVVGAAAIYFLLNTGFAAAATSLATGASLLATWRADYLWSAPSYFVGAGGAAV